MRSQVEGERSNENPARLRTESNISINTISEFPEGAVTGRNNHNLNEGAVVCKE